MGGFEFRDPWLASLVLLAPLVFAIAARMPSRLLVSTMDPLREAPRSLRERLALLPAVLLAVATALLALALAGPRTGDRSSSLKREGIAIVMAVDRSGSMNARDFVAGDASVSRLDAVKRVFHDFVEGGKAGAGRPDDLVGLVVFGTYADGICPLTLDHANLLSILDDVQVAKEASESFTAVGEGLGLAVERLRSNPAKSKVVILLTDGVSNAGDLDPMQAATLAADNGIRVYTIMAGNKGLAPVPVTGPDGREYLSRVYVETDEDTMKRIASATGGRFFHARDAEGLAEVYAEIDRLERSEITEVRYLEYREHYALLVQAAAVLVLLAALGSATVLRRLP